MGQQSQQPPNQMQRAEPGTEKTISPFYVGGGKTADVYGNMITDEQSNVNKFGAGTDPYVSQEMERSQNWGASIAPTFDTMFSKYVDVANREAGRQASQIGETLGSRGALYSSANLQQQADLRQKTAQDIGLQSQTFLKDLETQRQQAEQVRQQGWQGAMGARTAAETARQGGMGSVMTNQAGYAQAEYGAREAAMARAYQDFIRRSDVPPMVSTGIQTGANLPGAGFVGY